MKKSVVKVQDSITGSNHLGQSFCQKRAMLGAMDAQEEGGLIQLFISYSHSLPIIWLPPRLHQAVEKAEVISTFPSS